MKKKPAEDWKAREAQYAEKIASLRAEIEKCERALEHAVEVAEEDRATLTEQHLAILSLTKAVDYFRGIVERS